MKPTKKQEEALDVTKSICVTASAGTGKTTLLAERYVRSLKAEQILPKNILCLTYTDKAAVEMRDKIEKNIRDEYEAEQNPLLKKALDTFYQSNISTFHGFCARLLREFPLEAGVTPGFGIMDEVATAELTDTVLDEFLLAPPADLHDGLVFLFAHFGRFSVRNTLCTILGKWRILEPWYQKFAKNPEGVYQELEEKFKDRVVQQAHAMVSDSRLASFMEACTTSGYRENTNVLKIPEKFNRLKKAATFEEMNTVLLQMQKLTEKNLQAMHEKDLPEQDCSYYNSIVENIVAVEPCNNMPFLIEVMKQYAFLARELYVRVEERKKRNGMLNFDDLICSARILMENESVVRQLKERFRFILVDEVQDNDPTLTAIIETLRGNHDFDNRLFIVGDLKQSIYKFRGADPEGARNYFNTFSHSVDLDVCFRSLSPIIERVNTVFRPMFNGTKLGLSYAGVTGSRTGTHGSVLIIHHERQQKRIYPPDVIRQAEMVAGWIQHQVESRELLIEDHGKVRPATYGDIVILQDRGTDFPVLAEQLDAYGVPYRVVKGKEFYASPEVADFQFLFRAVVYPEDDIALFGVLTSPYFGISPAKLAQYPVQSSWDKSTLLSRLSVSSDTEILSALEMLQRFRSYQSSLPLIAFARRMVQETGILSVYATMKRGSERISNLDTILDFVSGYRGSVFSCIDRIGKNISAEAADEQGDDEIPEEDADFVRVMTIHASKGLEFPVVILSFAERKMVTMPGSVLADPELGLGLSIKIDEKKYLHSYSYTLLSKELHTAEVEERERLCYVAMTRAQDHLILAESGFEDSYDKTAFMTYYRNAVSPEADMITAELLGEPKDTGYSVSRPQNWDAVSPSSPEETADTELLRRGRCLHEVFEGKDAAEVCSRYGFPEDTDYFASRYANFRKSELMQSAAECWHELPVMNASCDNKRIDLLVRNKDGSFMIIDYKLGNSANQPEDLLKKYDEQLKGYANSVRDITGDTSVPAWLYFVEDETFVQVC